MISKIILSIVIILLILSVWIASFIYLGGIPVGVKNGHLLVRKSYCVTDAGCPKATKTFYARVKSENECKNLGGQIRLGGIGGLCGMRSQMTHED